MGRAVGIIAGLLIVAIGNSTAAHACDETCMTIQRVLNARSSNFANLRGVLSSESKDKLGGRYKIWKTSFSLSGHNCYVTQNTNPSRSHFACDGDFLGRPQAEAKEKFNLLASAIKTLHPEWKWVRDTSYEAPSVDVYAGPAMDQYLVHILLTHLGGEKFMTGIVIYAVPSNSAGLDFKKGDTSLKPYQP